MEGNCGCIE